MTVQISPRPSVQNEYEFKRLTPEHQASAIYEWQKFWLGWSAPSAAGVSGVSFAPIAVVPSANDNDVTIGGKLRPTKAELDGTGNDEWKRY